MCTDVDMNYLVSLVVQSKNGEESMYDKQLVVMELIWKCMKILRKHVNYVINVGNGLVNIQAMWLNYVNIWKKGLAGISNKKNIKTVQPEETQVLLDYLEMKNRTLYNVNNI